MKEEHSAAYKLFHYPYMFYVPRNETFDENDTEYFGRVSTGNEAWDLQLASAMEPVYMTPAEAAEFAGRKVRVDIHDPKDAVVIYRMLADHLNDWHRVVTQGAIRRKAVPLKGLREFNDLARQMAKIGRRHGLVELEIPSEQKRHHRTFSSGFVAPIQLKDFEHDESIFAEIHQQATIRHRLGGRS
jgi:hypothetical protein